MAKNNYDKIAPIYYNKIRVRVPDIPRGARTIRSMHAPVRLAELRFDPIDSAIETIAMIDARLNNFHAVMNGQVEPDEVDSVNEKGDVKLKMAAHNRFSNQAYNELLSMRQKAIADLMRYGYARVPETVKEEDDSKSKKNLVFNVVLTDNKTVQISGPDGPEDGT